MSVTVLHSSVCADSWIGIAGDVVGFWLRKAYNKQVNSSPASGLGCHVQAGQVRSQQRLPGFNSEDIKGSWLLFLPGQ